MERDSLKETNEELRCMQGTQGMFTVSPTIHSVVAAVSINCYLISTSLAALLGIDNN